MDTLADMTQKLHALFNKETGIMEIARKTGFVKRLNKITPHDFLKSAIITLMSQETASLRDYALSFRCHARKKLSKSAIAKRFTSECVDFLEALAKRLCETTLSHSFNFSALKEITSMVVLDSSELSLHDQLMGEFPGMRNIKSFLKLQTIMDGLQGTLKGIELTPGNCPDQSYKGHLPLVVRGALVVADLGYFACKTFREILDRGGHFLTRYHRRAALYDTDGRKISLAALLGQSGDCIVDIPVFLGKKNHIPCRLVAIHLTKEAFLKRSVALKKRKKRDPRMQGGAPTELDKWSILVTSLPADCLGALDAWSVYSCRWQIELLFKLLKSEFHLGQFTHHNVDRTKAEIYLKYIALCLMMMAAAAITTQEISLMKAAGVFKKFCGELFGTSYQGIYNGLFNLVSYFKRFAEKERRAKRPSSREKLGWRAIP